jgi:putative DNA primase/helicase
MTDIQDLANGRWPDLLSHFCALTPEQLSDKHQPCPLCGGKDRYRFDDRDGSGSWFCNQCGGRNQNGGAGSGMDLLMRSTGWSFTESLSRIRSYLNVPTPPPTEGAENVWHYSDTFLVARFPGKNIRPISWNGERWQFKAPPAPRPLLNLADLIARPSDPVIVVEGEKTADAASRLFPDQLITTWPSGCKAINKADWLPLVGRRVILWPDADKPGREAMAKLAAKLIREGIERVRIVNPPQDAPEGWDLADATWTPEEARAYIAANLSDPIELPPEPEPEPEPQPEPEPEPEPIPETETHFTTLGFDGNNYYYQPWSTGQVISISRGSHTGTNLCALAALPYWETLFPSKTGVNWVAAASALFQRSAKVGVYNPSCIRGRGAWWDDDRPILHLGDRLIVDGTPQPSAQRIKGSRFIYQRLSELEGPEIGNPLTKEESFHIVEIAERFLWEVPASGMLLAGWAALAPICGVLQWRPHAWLTAGAGSGKSTVLEDFIMPLLGDIGLTVVGNTTEAGIRQSLKSDARPVVFDECESNERHDQQRIQQILSLARIASFESRANLLKGSPDGTIQSFTVRSMFFMSSIATALKQGADKTRFVQLTLLNPKEAIPDAKQRNERWRSLERDLSTYISESIGRRLQARMVAMIPTVRKAVETFRRVAAVEFDNQRMGDQYGTLLAGAWCLMFDIAPTDQEAAELIRQNDWESYSQASEKSDEEACIERIMQAQLRVEGDRTVSRSIGELVDVHMGRAHDPDVDYSQAKAILGRNGIKVVSTEIFVSNSAQAIAHILRDTAWANCWPTVLLRLPGASRAGVTHFSGAGNSSRAVKIPASVL